MLRDELIHALQDLKDADSIEELLTYKTIKKLEGFSRHYRLRVEKYRLGFKHEDDGSLTLLHFKNLGEFYSKKAFRKVVLNINDAEFQKRCLMRCPHWKSRLILRVSAYR